MAFGYHLKIKDFMKFSYKAKEKLDMQLQSWQERRLFIHQFCKKLSSQPSASKSFSSFTESSKIERDSSSSEFEESDEQFEIDNEITDEEYNNLKKRPKKYSSCKIATKLAVSAKVSTKKASNIGKILSSEGIHVPAPSQSGIYKALFKEAKKFKETLIQDLKNENWSLHFDGKHIDQ